MFTRQTLILTLLPLTFAAVACGTAETVAGDPPPTTVDAPDPTTPEPTPEPTAPSDPPPTPTPTDPPPTTVAPSNPPPSDPPPNDPPAPALPEVDVEVDEGGWDSIGEMADAADAVVVATVVAEERLAPGRTDVNPLPEAHLGLELRIDEVLRGDIDGTVRLAWHAFTLGADGEPTAWNVMNGVPVPHTGDQLVLFLVETDDHLLGDVATHATTKLDGIGFLDAGVVTVTDRWASEGASLLGLTVDEIRSAI